MTFMDSCCVNLLTRNTPAGVGITHTGNDTKN